MHFTVEQQLDMRREALRAALQLKDRNYATARERDFGTLTTAHGVIADAKQIEEYLRGTNGAATPKRKAKR